MIEQVKDRASQPISYKQSVYLRLSENLHIDAYMQLLGLDDVELYRRNTL